jgi:calcineurin-like phosphoesterase family protein
VVSAALGLAVLVSATGIAQSHLAQSSAKGRAPLRAVLYLTAPLRPGGLTGRPAPQSVPHGQAAVKRDLAALAWARADVAIVPWATPGSAADARLAALLAAISSTRAHVRVAALIDRSRGTEAAQVNALVTSRARLRSYLRVGSKIAVFVALADHSRRGCAQARRWRAAGRGLWLVQATFPGYGLCRAAADAWFRDTPDTRSTRASGTFLIRPGFWPRGSRVEKLKRSPSAWQRSIQRMTVSGEPLQLIDSLNDWARGTAIEPSAAWPSESGFGSYLDALHAQPPGVVTPGGGTPGGGTPGGNPGGGTPGGGTPGLEAPTADAVAVSGVTAHEATLASVVSAGSASATWQVQYGATTAYGQTTAPVPLAAGSARLAVSVLLSSLADVTTYHARVVVVSSVGSVASADSVFTTLADSAAVRVAAAGDIACDPTDPSFNGGAGTPAECQQKAVADAILARAYDAVLPLGDEQYNNGTASQFAASYNPSWGRFKAISHPAIGNHEYGTPTLAYFQYFGAAAGDPGKGYYSYDLGSWHVLVINSNCSFIGGCNPGSPQENWVRADLAAHRVSCTLAYFHHPRFSSGQAGDDLEMSSIWSDLVGSGVDLVLTGHDHEYERFAPQNASGGRDDAHGAREFVVGTGGMNHMSFRAAIKPNSEARNNTSFGFLDLSLGTGSYSWRFVSVPPGGFSDSGSASCH